MVGQDDNTYDDQSVVKTVDQLIEAAIDKRASDIHLEPQESGLRIRLRIDGALYDYQVIDQRIMNQVISRIKVLSHIDIAEKRAPHDGKYTIVYHNRPIDLRISTFPTTFGEKIVIRILDRTAHMIALEKIGFAQDVLDQFLEVIKKPHGFILVTGPTGSGKTTTLYSVLSLLNDPQKNIITLEDPVEYHLEGVTQGHINPEAGFTFERGMRALLRQDPNILMVGEIRDQQTAQIAIEAALTGHLVLSTLHTNDAPSAFMRLIDMGIEPFLITASLTGVVAQRLAKTICVHCRRERKPSVDEAYLMNRVGLAQDQVIYEGIGCKECDGRGQKGRIGVFEFLKTTPELKELLSGQPKYDSMYARAVEDGMKPLVHDAAQKVKAGTISLAELARIVC